MELYEYEKVQIFTDSITQSRYSSTARKILNQVNNGYYQQEELSTSAAEAFYSDFKRFSISELREIQKENNIIARDGHFIDENGLSVDYEKVLKSVLSPQNIEQQTQRFLASNFGEEVENKYISNLNAQKDYARQMFITFFENNNQEPNFEALRNKSIYSIYNETKDEMPKSVKFSTDYQNFDPKFGVPKFTLEHDGKKAEFSTGAELKHLLTDKEYLNMIKEHIENPAYEPEQENVWDRLPENKKTTYAKSVKKNRI